MKIKNAFAIVLLFALFLSVAGQSSQMPNARYFTGPYQVKKVSATKSQIVMRLMDDPLTLSKELMGGVELNDRTNGLDPNGDPIKETLRVFKFLYLGAGARNLEFRSTFKYTYNATLAETAWVATLDSTNAYGEDIGFDGFDVEGLYSQQFVVTKHNDLLPIWNGKYAAISFSTDDGNDENYDIYRDAFKDFGWRYSLFINYGYLGTTGKMTKAEVVTMEGEGFEIGSHTMYHFPVDNYDGYYAAPRLWNPASVTIGNYDAFGSTSTLIFALEADNLWKETTNMDTCGVWPDSAHSRVLSPTGVRFFNTTAAEKPHFILNGSNGMPCVRYDGVSSNLNKHLYLGGLKADVADGSRTFFFVLDPDSIAGISQDSWLLDARQVASPNDRTMIRLRMNDANGRMRVSTGSDVQLTEWNEKPVTGKHILCFVGTVGSGWECYRNGKKLTKASSGTFAGELFPQANVRLGMEINKGGDYDGDFYEVLAFSSALSTARRQRIEGYLAHKYTLVDSLAVNHPYKYRAPEYPMYHFSRVMTEMYGNKTLLEELINYNKGNWKGRDYSCDVLAFPGGGDRGSDETMIAMSMIGYLGNRLTGYATTDSLAGYRGRGYLPPAWNHVDPYFMPITWSISQIIDEGGDSQTYWDNTKANMRSLLTGILENANPTWDNPWIVLYWHRDDGTELVTDGHLRAMLEATQDAADSLWVMPWGEGLKYWRKAHPELLPESYRSLQ